MCFTIRLRSNVELYLSRGCVILAANSPRPDETTEYDGGTYDSAGPAQPWEAYQDYGHNHWSNSLFYGEGLNDISIVGPGLIHGRGLSYGQGARVGARPDPLRVPVAYLRRSEALMLIDALLSHSEEACRRISPGLPCDCISARAIPEKTLRRFPL